MREKFQSKQQIPSRLTIRKSLPWGGVKFNSTTKRKRNNHLTTSSGWRWKWRMVACIFYIFCPAVKWKSNIKDFKTKLDNNRIIITKKSTAPTRPITLFRHFKKKKLLPGALSSWCCATAPFSPCAITKIRKRLNFVKKTPSCTVVIQNEVAFEIGRKSAAKCGSDRINKFGAKCSESPV